MISMQTTLLTDIWVSATWEEYEQAIAPLEEALQRSRQMDNSQVGSWFLMEVQK